jgi:rare lipoprotein A (peptidoglycan hydrolase)
MPFVCRCGRDGHRLVYGNENVQWRRADGRRFVPSQIVCAHKTRKLGNVVRVTVLATGLDLSESAARALGRTMVRLHQVLVAVVPPISRSC